MAQMLLIYKTPGDTAAFDKYYFGTHVPLAKKLPGLRKYEVSQGPVQIPSGPSNLYFVAALHFDNMSAIQQALMSAEGQAAAADVLSLTTDRPYLLLFDSREV